MFPDAAGRGVVQALYHDGFVQLFAETLSVGHAWGDSEPVGQMMVALGIQRVHTEYGNVYRLVKLKDSSAAEAFSRCDLSAGTPPAKGLREG